MTDLQYDLIRKAREVLESSAKGTQWMGLEGNVATFEIFGRNKGEYVTLTIDLDLVEKDIYEFVENYVTVNSYDQEDGSTEYDVDMFTYTYDENMNEIDFKDVTLKTYKREGYANNFAQSLGRTIK